MYVHFYISHEATLGHQVSASCSILVWRACHRPYIVGMAVIGTETEILSEKCVRSLLLNTSFRNRSGQVGFKYFSRPNRAQKKKQLTFVNMCM